MIRIIFYILMAAIVSLPRLCGAADILLDEKACGSLQSLDVGDILEVRLPGNPTTGYVWEATLPALLRQKGDSVHLRDSQFVGTGGITSFTFIANRAGYGDLDLVWKRPWEKDIPPAKACRIRLSSTTNRNIQPAGKKIGLDEQGNAIYQVHANGIEISKPEGVQ